MYIRAAAPAAHANIPLGRSPILSTAPASAFVNVNGIRLHYLDWGGEGPPLVFLAGLRTSAYIFGSLAPRFADAFHVLGLDRRGHGDSDQPDAGYDPDTLAEDLRQFLDALHIDRVILAGHSLAYLELTRFANLYPQRVLKLVFIEAAYDFSSPAYNGIWDKNPAPRFLPRWPERPPATIEEFVSTVKRVSPSLAAIWAPVFEEDIRHTVRTTPEGVVDRMNDETAAALSAACNAYRPEYASLRPPVLSIFALRDGLDYLAPQYMSRDQRGEVLEYFQHTFTPFLADYIERFKKLLPEARVVVLPHSHHHCFIKDEQRVYEAIRQFLLET